MKNLIILTLVLISASMYSQEEINPKKINSEFKVYGACDMCKSRIEEALDVKGVKFSEWNKDTKNLKVVYNSEKIALDDIHKLLTKVGHDTDKMKATDEDYNALHGCCKYR